MILRDLLHSGRQTLLEAGITGAALDARVLFQAASGWTSAELIARERDQVEAEQSAAFRQLIDRRVKGEPVSQITGEKEFWSLTFRVSRDVLTPRPDSESLIELALALYTDRPPQTILDIGTGSGCLLVALLKEFPESEGLGIDLSREALAVAQENISRHNLQSRASLKLADFHQPVPGTYDLVISNPPYIREDAREGLPEEVRSFEPGMALFAGPDGLSAYRAITAQLPRLLRSGGTAILEAGQGQAALIEDLISHAFRQAGREYTLSSRQDLAGIPRAIAVTAC